MKPLVSLDIQSWTDLVSSEQKQQAVSALESGSVLYLPNLPFQLKKEEEIFLSPAYVNNKVKNISYDLNQQNVRGSTATETSLADLQKFMHRYANTAQSFMRNLFSVYGENLKTARTSYRPTQIAGRISSYRKDDSRLHVDAFPASPVHGKRILRIFTNVNPWGESRVWRVGDLFSNVVDAFKKELAIFKPWQAKWMQCLKITRSYRSAYDHYMLKLHNAMKVNNHYQKHAPQTQLDLAPGATWIVYTDVVSHAAMSGQFVFEQTFHLSVDAMQEPNLSPLRILENKLQRALL
jgi:hypothetical protein